MDTPDGRITRSLLKSISGEFDLESIHTLTLNRLDISDLGCLGECQGLERCDLSYNDITKLHKLAGLSALQSLNLSANRISSLDGLQSLENLRSLNLAGNLIGSVNSLRCLSGLSLKELRLKDEGRELSNPACMMSSYTSDVIDMFPSLMVLDGQRVRGKGSEVFYICQEMNKALNSWGPSEINVPLVDVTRQPSDLWKLPDPKTAGHNKALVQLKDVLTSCHHLSVRASERLQELKASQSQSQSSDSMASEPTAQPS